jgi:hypothetical protein
MVVSRYYKLGRGKGDKDIELIHKPLYWRSIMTNDQYRIEAAMPSSAVDFFLNVCKLFKPPYSLLYVLKIPHGAERAGRFQSPFFEWDVLEDFLRRNSTYLNGDGRFDLWLSAPNEDAQLVWDNHNIL